MVVVHHLSDLHIGPLHYHPQMQDFSEEFAGDTNLLDRYESYIGGQKQKPDVVIISGDLTSYATELEFNKASDFIGRLTKLLDGKRTQTQICIVPGNHDLDWTQDDQKKKQDRFRRLCERHPHVVSPYAAKPFVHLKKHNLLIWCFNSCSLGGIQNPTLQSLAKNLQSVFGSLGSPPPKSKWRQYLQLLEKLQKLSRQDPGYITPADRALLDKEIHSKHDAIFKIAVMHHNPSLLPTEDEDAFQTIVNGGVVKQLLLRKGFDLILHGHRHFPHASYEEFLEDETVNPRATGGQYRHGVYTVSGPSLGCASLDETRWFEIVIEDSGNVYEKGPPSSLVTIRSAILKGQQYVLKAEPSFRITIGKRVNADFHWVHEHLGRVVGRQEERHRTRVAIDNIRLPLLRLQADLEDWNAKEEDNWASIFHGRLANYGFIYGTDNLGPASWLNPVYLEYLARQFSERRNRWTASGEGTSMLRFSSHVMRAIQQTGWKPLHVASPKQLDNGTGGFSKTNLEERQHGSSGLEIVRILVWDKKARQEAGFLRMIERYHQMFGVPVFVLPAEKLDDEDRDEEFVLGLDAQRMIERCFRFRLRESYKTDDLNAVLGAPRYLERFEKFLAHPDLICIGKIHGCELVA